MRYSSCPENRTLRVSDPQLGARTAAPQGDRPALVVEHVVLREKKHAMKTWLKVTIGVAAVVVVLAIVFGTIYFSGRNVAIVQTAKAQTGDLTAVVSASGEIRPKTYVNVGANAFGKITHLYVKEGDKVRQGQLLAQLEN